MNKLKLYFISVLLYVYQLSDLISAKIIEGELDTKEVNHKTLYSVPLLDCY